MSGEWRYHSKLVLASDMIVMTEGFIAMLRLNVNRSLAVGLYIGLSIISAYSLCGMKVKYHADEDGVEIRTPFRKYFFDYSEIISLKAETSEKGHSHNRTGENGTYYECCMTIVTEKKIYRFFEPLGLVLAEDAVNFPDKLQSRLYDTEMAQLTEYIKERKRK